MLFQAFYSNVLELNTILCIQSSFFNQPKERKSVRMNRIPILVLIFAFIVASLPNTELQQSKLTFTEPSERAFLSFLSGIGNSIQKILIIPSLVSVIIAEINFGLTPIDIAGLMYRTFLMISIFRLES